MSLPPLDEFGRSFGRALALPISLALLFVAAAAHESTPLTRAPEPDPIRYDRDIRPILSDRCFRCHGPDAQARKADLRLDSFESATADLGGHAAIVPGSLETSELWSRVHDADPDEGMPPARSKKPRLSEDELERIGRWIRAGAKYEAHWSFVPPVRPALPVVANEAWAKNAIDRFVLAKLEHEGVKPSAPADRETWLRRVFLDLTGLPPTPEELDAFVADTAPDAAGRWVDRLFDEEPYRSRCAERMATPWLDAARYADTSGIHTDAGRSIWPWRDWVLRAYRDNMPFDRFLTEQLAGDLIPGATLDQRVASGFNRNHVTTDEGGAIAEEYLVEYAVDRAATTGSVFLGLTMGCARCHDHKFDPISQSEFYGFLAYFNSIDEPGLYSQLPDAKRALEPYIEVPSAAQARELETLRTQIAAARAVSEKPVPGEDEARAQFIADERHSAGIAWECPRVIAARSSAESPSESSKGAVLTVQADGSVLASGPNPDRDEHRITVRTSSKDLRLLALEALTHPTLGDGRVGRSANGNAVLTGVECSVRSIADPSQSRTVSFVWAWADREQEDGDFAAVNVLDTNDERGWALDAHRFGGGRILLLLADAPFGFDGGSEIEISLQYHSQYAQHVLGDVRIAFSPLTDAGIAKLPLASGRWSLVGPFPAASGKEAFDKAYGPESDVRLDRQHNFGFGNQVWTFDPALADARLNYGLPKGINATYVGRELFVPSPRTVNASLGSDDGFRIFVDAHERSSRAVDRGLAADQDKAELELTAGRHALLVKVVNTGGEGGFYWRFEPREHELAGDLMLAFAPESALGGERSARLHSAWRAAFSPGYREQLDTIRRLETQLAGITEMIPRTMVMAELAAPRVTHVLMRGAYDKPDMNRPVERGVPRALGTLPDGAASNRLGLAQWMTDASNPLVARVAVNRLWEMVFGTGLVRTSGDFGQQGEWPSHLELLDWLAVEFRESGWDVRALLRLIVTSNTYAQSSRARPELAERDPDNRWLSYFPRRRLGAEEIRDGALYVSGLLVEKLGGPSVKPYQPDGLWEEVAMPASNTRLFALGTGEELWRRSLYTYWKRASPPPALMALDAPTRESCLVRRASTNTPLQALALWNDTQFVEAARVFAEHALADERDDRARLAEMFRRASGQRADADELDLMAATLAQFRERYRGHADDAQKLVGVGASPRSPALDPCELAAWTMIASSLLSLDATISRG